MVSSEGISFHSARGIFPHLVNRASCIAQKITTKLQTNIEKGKEKAFSLGIAVLVFCSRANPARGPSQEVSYTKWCRNGAMAEDRKEGCQIDQILPSEDSSFLEPFPWSLLRPSETSLDPRAAVPSTTGCRVVGRRCRLAAHPINAQRGRNQPANSRQESKGLVGLPGATVGTAQTKTAPVKSVAAAVAQPIDEEGEGDKPADGDDEIGGPVDERPGEGEQPDDGEENGKGGDDLGVDEAAEGPR